MFRILKYMICIQFASWILIRILMQTVDADQGGYVFTKINVRYLVVFFQFKGQSSYHVDTVSTI
jgi:hypothetical protein